MIKDEIRMDKKVFEALASETRVDLLKKLAIRQMTITELSNELGLAKSSVHEHLSKMVDVDFVEKIDDSHKWTYYRLTNKGRKILHPDETTKILLLLSSTILALVSGLWSILNFAKGPIKVEIASQISQAKGLPTAILAPTTPPPTLLVAEEALEGGNLL